MEGWWRWWPSFDLVDKIIQWMLPPRLVQLVAVFGFTLLTTLVHRPVASNGGYCRQHRLPPCLSLFQPACSTVGY